MAQHTQEENTTCVKPMEEEEEEEEHQHEDWPLLSQEQDGPSAKPTSSVKSSSLRSRVEQEASGSGIRSLSFSKLLSFRIGKGASLDIDELAADGDDADACAKKKEQQKQKQQPVCRSQSLPMTSIRRFPHSCKKRVADSSSLSRFRVSPVRPEPSSKEEETEEVGEEEAVCRVCMVALWEGSVLKLECQCKGELALAHRDCALKWFGIKGNANCDVCSHDVLNLPVTLRRIHSSASPTNAAAAAASVAAAADSNNTSRGGGFGVWQHGTPILVIVSMLAYFCFLEQLLVGDHGTAALAISLPFAGVLGLFSSLTTTKMVSRRYVSIYSAFQFLFIVLFSLHPHLLQIRADAGGHRHHPLHLCGLRRRHLRQRHAPPDHQMEVQAPAAIRPRDRSAIAILLPNLIISIAIHENHFLRLTVVMVDSDS